jgi:integrase
MPVTVVTTPNGYLQYRLRSKGIPGYYSKESTRIPDDREHRDQHRLMERHAKLMSAEMAAGKFDYLAWFPSGSKAAHFRRKVETTTVGDYITGTWLPRKQPPLVRLSTAKTYAKHVRCHIVPAFGDSRFADVTVAALEDFRTLLIGAEASGGKGLAVKTARDVIDGTFRAIYRDGRKVGLATDDPFAALDWPDKILPEPDPFTPAERDALLDYFHAKDRFWHPFVFTQFWTGMRPSEAIGLRRARLDLKQARLSVVVSRSYGEDNPPKTKGSRRTITLLPDVVRVLRDMPRPALPKPDDFVFTTPEGHAIDADRFVEQHWHRALSATGTRPRPFYNCRHSFISCALERGAKIKWLADYCGTSIEMLQKHYARWLQGDDHQLALLVGPSDRLEETPSATAPSNRSDGPISGDKGGKIGTNRDGRHLRKIARKN